MKQILAILAAVAALATAAGASTLSVISTNTSNTPQNTFISGETIRLQVDGTPTGVDNGVSGRLLWTAAGGTAFSATQTQVQSSVLPLFMGTFMGTAFSDVFNQTNLDGRATPPTNPTFLGTVLLIAGAPGTYDVTWSEELDFFGLYASNTPSLATSFTIIPEPATAGLIGLGLLGLVLGGRRRS